MIKAVIFDCFGVIVGRGFRYTYQLAGGNPEEDQVFIESILGQANLGMISEADFHRQVAGKLKISQAEWLAAIQRSEQPDTELLKYIEQLRQTYKTAILSNANRGVVLARIGADWIERCFDAVIVSAEVNMLKPDPSIYKYTADQLNVEPSECVFFDDREYQLAPARKLGMQAFIYTDLERAKGDLSKVLTSQSW